MFAHIEICKNYRECGILVIKGKNMDALTWLALALIKCALELKKSCLGIQKETTNLRHCSGQKRYCYFQTEGVVLCMLKYRSGHHYINTSTSTRSISLETVLQLMRF